MISLRRTMEREDAKQDWQEAMLSYLAALEGIRDYALRACPPLTDDFAEEMQQLVEHASAQTGVAHLKSSRERLLQTLRRFGDEASKSFESRTNEIREVVKLVALGTQALQGRSRRNVEELEQQANTVEQIAALSDLAEVRRKLTVQVIRMRESLARIATEDTGTIERLTAEADLLRDRLHAAEQTACQDEVTGLANRRGLERQMDVRIRRKTKFCLVLFDIRNLCSVMEAHGRPTADEMLKEFATRMKHSIRENDVASRWGGDQFIILMECPLHDVLPRSRQIYERLTGKYSITLDGRQLRLQVVASMGVAEHRTGEGKDQLMARADALMYETRKVSRQ